MAFGLGVDPQTWMHPLLHLALEMLLLPLAVCWPMHRLLLRRFGVAGVAAR